MKRIQDAFRKNKKMMKQLIKERKFVQGIGAAAAIGITAGIFAGLKSTTRIREEANNKPADATITIEVHGLENIRIERIK